MMEAMAELMPEIEAHLSAPVPALPSLSDVLTDLGSLPGESLFLGIATDDLPVLLNLHDSVPGPLLVIADPNAGKTSLLQTISRAVGFTHSPNEVQFGIITNYPDEWNGIARLQHCAGVFPFYETSSQDFILSLASWAHANKNSQQSVLLLIDGLESVTKLDFDAQQNLRWLLFRGPARRVWPIITLNTQQYEQVGSWLDIFRTRIYGHIQDNEIANRLNAGNANLDKLLLGSEFSMPEGMDWLKFWIPS